MPDREDLEAVAHLVGATNAQIKQLDTQIVSSSTNLQTSNDNWDPKAVLNSAVQELSLAPAELVTAPVPAPMSVPVQAPVHGSQQFVQPVPTMSPDALTALLRIEQKLDVYMAHVQKLETIGNSINKSIERGMKSKFKQVTIKLDDSNNTK
jgi:hypothetical protein